MLITGMSAPLGQVFVAVARSYNLLLQMLIMIFIIMFNFSLYKYYFFWPLLKPNEFRLYDNESEKLIATNPCTPANPQFDMCFYNIGNIGKISTTIHCTHHYNRCERSKRYGLNCWNLGLQPKQGTILP